MNVYKKLQAARERLQQTALSKSGENKYAKFKYFELGDFIPQVTKIFDDIGLCGVVNFTHELATLTVYDADADGSIVFCTPLVHANVEKVQPIQNLGATHTYMRRYLWLMAMEIVEHDAVDSAEPRERVAPKPTNAPTPKPVVQPAKAPVAPKAIEGKPGAWQIKVSVEPNELEESFKEWAAMVHDATLLALDNAGSEADVMAIFRNNKNIFDKVKEDALAYEEILAMFTKAKNKFKKDEE
jgi:hypothetical protein